MADRERDDHPRHDAVAIAASVERGMSTPPSLRACLACIGLRADLLAIRTFLPTASIPRRGRDFRLTTADATRLRRRGWRALAAVGTAREPFTRPLAVSFTALGLVGILLTAMPSGPSSAMPGIGGAAGVTSAETPTSAVDAPRDSATVQGRVRSRMPMTEGGVPEVARDGTSVTPTDTTPLTALSVAMLAVGSTLFGVRRLASRWGRMR